MVLFPVQSKNVIFNHYTVIKKQRGTQNILIMSDKLYHISSPVCVILVSSNPFKFSDSF